MLQRIADKLGLPVQTVRSSLYALERKARGILRENGLYLYRMEKRLEKETKGILNKQLAYVLKHAKELTAFKEKGIRVVQRKALYDELRDLTYNLPHKKDMVNALARYSALVMLKGARTRIDKLKLAEFGISFDLSNTVARDFISGLTTLHLSDRNGSITRTTKDGIIKVISQSVNEGLGYNDTAKRIMALGEEGVFSRARAQLISTHTTAQAYEFGNREPMKEAQQKGLRVQKFWQTVEDDKVTPECEANQKEDWLELEEAHSSGDQNPPRIGNPRCRCSEAYRVLD